jgi:Ca-activated chloride channel family protein
VGTAVSFAWPLVLLGLLAVPAIVALYIYRERRRRSSAAGFANPALLPNVVASAPGLRRHLPPAVLLVALAALIVGIARPHATVTTPVEEATVVLAVDVSRSMTASDVRPTRLAAARSAARAFLRKVPEKFRVGVVSFASRAVVALPPTDDRELVEESLTQLRSGEGTALGDAVALSTRIAQSRRTSVGTVPPAAVLLISDGANEGGRLTPAAAVQRARSRGVRVYTVVLGTANGRVERRLAGGYREIIRVPPSPETLRQIALATRGRFFTASNDARLRQVYERLGSRLGRTTESREITDLFAGGSAALMLVGGALSAFWFRRVP